MKHLLLSLFAIAALRLSVLDYYVSPAGSDANAGILTAPFATLAKARDVIRTLKTSPGLPAKGLTVWLRGGYYNFSTTLTFTSADPGTAAQPIVYASYQGEEAHITGSATLSSNWFSPVTENSPVWTRPDPAARGKVYIADLSAHGITDYGTINISGFSRQAAAPLELFFNERPMTLARWPNKDAALIRLITAPTTTQFAYARDRPTRWSQFSNIWVHGFWYLAWADFCLPISSIDTAFRTVMLGQTPPTYGPTSRRPFLFYNILEELDDPSAPHSKNKGI